MHKKSSRFSLSCTLAALVLAAGLPAYAQEVTRQDKIEHILNLMNSQASVNQMLDQFTTMINSQVKTMAPNASPEQQSQAQELQKKLIDMLKSRMSWDRMRPEMIRIYGETYSDEELNGMLAFFESPAGQGFLSKSPVLVQKTMEVSQAQLADIMPEIQRIVKEAQKKQ